MKLLTYQEVWPDITSALRVVGRNRALCAISYIGETAGQYLPLKRGDILICDAEVATIKSGATRASALAVYHRKGVQIDSKPGLHAKLIATSKTAWVGSANASQTSAEGKAEASLKVNDPKIVKEARNFVEKLIEDPKTNKFDAKSIGELLMIPYKKSDWGSTIAEPYLLPKSLQTIKTFVNTELVKVNSEERKLTSDTKGIALKERNKLGTDLSLENFYATPSVRLKKGDWVITGLDDKISSPGVVVSVKKGRRSSVFWIARPDVSVSEVERLRFENYLGKKLSKTVEVSTLTGLFAAKTLRFFNK